MSSSVIVVKHRSSTGKQANKALRRSGMIPSVIYGMNQPAVSIMIEPKAINKILHSDKGLNTVFDLQLEGSDHAGHVMVKHVDRHPVNDHLIHLDFMRIDMNKVVTVMIPVEFSGTPEGVKLGGVLTITRHEVEVSSLPSTLPGVIRVDVTHLGMDQALRVGDLPKLAGVKYTLGDHRTVAVVHAAGRQIDHAEEEAAG